MTASHAAPYRPESDWPTTLGVNSPRPHPGRHLPSAETTQPTGYAPLMASSHVNGRHKPSLTIEPNPYPRPASWHRETLDDGWDMLVIL